MTAEKALQNLKDLAVGAWVRAKVSMSVVGIWYAVTLHAIWTMLLLGGLNASKATAVSGPSKLFPNHYGLAIIFALVAGMALLGIMLNKLSPTKILLLVPQQLMLGLSAASALHAMAAAHYADGVPRPRAFIIADQSPAVLALIMHSVTVFWLTARYSKDHGE